MAQKPKLEKLAGRVCSQAVLQGTASAHEGVVLETTDGERVRLQRIGGNPFQDDVTSALVGKTVSVAGYRLGDIFRFTEVEEE